VKSNASRYFARIIRAIVVTCLGFGGGIGLLTFITILVMTGHHKPLAALQAGLVLGIGFGVFWAVLLLLLDLTGRLFAAKGMHDEVWELEQAREIDVTGSLRDARAVGRGALLAVPNLKAVQEGEDEHEIDASVGQSWKSPGEKMTVIIREGEGENQWKVRCTSACLATNVAFDYGKNFENVETWLRTAMRLVSESQTAKPN
jgi:hypothetical protein